MDVLFGPIDPIGEGAGGHDLFPWPAGAAAIRKDSGPAVGEAAPECERARRPLPEFEPALIVAVEHHH